jgi:hypothetical protein
MPPTLLLITSTDATAEDLDITDEVRQCQNLCPLTFGVGNSDLSGIGVSLPCLVVYYLD